jgi:hypothetical protein
VSELRESCGARPARASEQRCSCRRRLHARHGIGSVVDVELLARTWPVEDRAALNEHDIGDPLDAFPLASDGGPRRRSNVSSSSSAMARHESTPARLIVSRSCSAAGPSAALTGTRVECLGMPKDAQASPSLQAVTLITRFRTRPQLPRSRQLASSASLESSTWRTTLCKLRAAESGTCQKRIFLPLQLCAHSAMN